MRYDLKIPVSKKGATALTFIESICLSYGIYVIRRLRHADAVIRNESEIENGIFTPRP